MRAGLTISTSITVAVMTVAAFKAIRKIGGTSNILEVNISQTIGSAFSIASGVISTLPALFLWGFAPTLFQMTLLALCGGLLGIGISAAAFIKGARRLQELGVTGPGTLRCHFPLTKKGK